jgi:hypothetical protein
MLSTLSSVGALSALLVQSDWMLPSIRIASSRAITWLKPRDSLRGLLPPRKELSDLESQRLWCSSHLHFEFDVHARSEAGRRDFARTFFTGTR